MVQVVLDGAQLGDVVLDVGDQLRRGNVGIAGTSMGVQAAWPLIACAERACLGMCISPLSSESTPIWRILITFLLMPPILARVSIQFDAGNDARDALAPFNILSVPSHSKELLPE